MRSCNFGKTAANFPKTLMQESIPLYSPEGAIGLVLWLKANGNVT